MIERSLWKSVKYRQKTNAGPSSSQGAKRSLRDIAQITNVDKSTPSRIGKYLPSNDNVTLEKMLYPSNVQERCIDCIDKRRTSDVNGAP